jgi:trehalose/maltose transport system substrate-binding protein
MCRSIHLAVLVSVALVLAGCGNPGSESDEVTLVFAGGSVGEELDLTLASLRTFMDQNPGIRVHVRPTPSNDSERFDMYRDMLTGGSKAVDIFQIDVVWTQALAGNALDLSPFFEATEVKKLFDIIIENNTVDGKLVGIPWFTDGPVLYYRSDLLEKYNFENPPGTWDELERMARVIQEGERRDGNLGFWGYVWQGNAYEGLTCNALEWQSSMGAGNFLKANGTPSINHTESKRAFQRAARWLGTISPREVVDWDEEESRLFWIKGDAAFMRNWPISYVKAKASALEDKFGVSPMPTGEGGSAAVLGGWQLMVSRHSRNPQAAVKLVRYLTSVEEQKRRAVEGSYNPTIRALYEDPEILEAVPFFRNFDETVAQAVLRPSKPAGDRYDQVSEAYWTSVRNILMGGDASAELSAGEKRIEQSLK